MLSICRACVDVRAQWVPSLHIQPTCTSAHTALLRKHIVSLQPQRWRVEYVQDQTLQTRELRTSFGLVVSPGATAVTNGGWFPTWNSSADEVPSDGACSARVCQMRTALRPQAALMITPDLPGGAL